MTPNPLARRRRLGSALLKLRNDRGHSHATLAKASGISASVISRVESPLGDLSRRPNLLHVRRLLDALDVPRGSHEAVEIERHVEIANERYWWDSHPHMGEGQKLVALVEHGAREITEYVSQLLPGLVQTERYAHHRVLATNGHPVDEPGPVVAGRLARKRILNEAGVTYRLVLEEQAVRRHPVPLPVMADQLRHLLFLMEHPHISVRIVPVAADLGGGYVPRAPFTHLSYRDPTDPQIVIVDSGHRVDLVTEDDEIKMYTRLHQRLRGAALSDADSAALINEVVSSLTA